MSEQSTEARIKWVNKQIVAAYALIDRMDRFIVDLNADLEKAEALAPDHIVAGGELIAEINRLTAERDHADLRAGRAARDRATLYKRAEAKIDELRDTIEGLSSKLDSAVEVAFRRGATEWVRLNYPEKFAALTTCPHCHRPHTDPMVCGRGGCPMGGDQ